MLKPMALEGEPPPPSLLVPRAYAGAEVLVKLERAGEAKGLFRLVALADAELVGREVARSLEHRFQPPQLRLGVPQRTPHPRGHRPRRRHRAWCSAWLRNVVPFGPQGGCEGDSHGGAARLKPREVRKEARRRGVADGSQLSGPLLRDLGGPVGGVLVGGGNISPGICEWFTGFALSPWAVRRRERWGPRTET